MLPSDDPSTPSARVRTAWRPPLAAAALVAAAAHLPVTGEHLREALYIGVLFIALEVACLVLAVALLVRPTRAVLAATAVVGALAVAALVVSRTVGLPLIGDDVGDWTEPLALISLVAESLMAVGGALAIARPRATATALRVGAAFGLAVLLAGGAATGVAALAAGDTAEHATGHGHGMDGMDGMDMSGMQSQHGS